MDLSELRLMVKEICKYFKDQKVPADDVLELWLDVVEEVPATKLDWIVEEIKKRKSLPTNLPRVIKSTWKYYIKSHPEEITLAKEHSEEKWNCPDCHGTTVLHYRRKHSKKNMKYTYIAICATCENTNESKFGRTLKEGGSIMGKDDKGVWKAIKEFKSPEPEGKRIPGLPHFTKQQIIDKGYEFLPAENTFADKIRPDVDELIHNIGQAIPGGPQMSEADKEKRRSELLKQAEEPEEDEFKEVNEMRERILKRHGRL